MKEPPSHSEQRELQVKVDAEGDPQDAVITMQADTREGGCVDQCGRWHSSPACANPAQAGPGHR
eukprot:10020821-Heterocapsa_arctica.AAC.1